MKFYFQFGPVMQEEMPFKGIFIWSSGSPFVQWRVNICAILLEGIIRNNFVKLFLIWASGSGGDDI